MCVKYKTLQNLLTPKRYSSAACTVCLTVLCATVTVRLKKWRVETCSHIERPQTEKIMGIPVCLSAYRCPGRPNIYYILQACNDS